MRKKKYRVLALLAIAMLLGTSIPGSRVEAGARTNTLSGTSFKSDGDWNNLKDDVKVDGTKLIFPVDSTEKTGFICKSVIRADEFFSNLATVECDLKLTKLPQGQSFVLAFGLARIESSMGDQGNVEVVFTNDNGIKVGVVAYEKKGTATTVCSPRTAGMSLNSTAGVKAEITNDGKIQVMINGQTVCTGSLPITGEGRIGFIQSGQCGAEVDNFKLTYYQYYRPENTNIDEDFEEGSLNISVLTGKTLDGKKTFNFEKYNDSTVMMFRGVGQTYLGTQYSYSNFEMTFDVPYMTMTSSVTDDGEAIEGTGQIGIAFGSERTSLSLNAYKNAIDMVTFGNGTVYSMKNEEKYSAENPYWQENKPFSVRVALEDCVVTVGAKWMNEANYHTLLSYQIANSDVTGYVHFMVVDRANLAIDNLKITNLDHNPTLIEKEFVSGRLVKPDDYVYEPFERVYAQEPSDAKQKTFSWYLLIPTAVLAGVLALVVTDRIIYIRGRRRKESDNK